MFCWGGDCKNSDEAAQKRWIKRPENRISQIMEETQGFNCSKQAYVSADSHNVCTETLLHRVFRIRFFLLCL